MKKLLILSLIITVGLALRFFVSLRGYNYDFESYVIVGKIVNLGKVVYAETTRYNYGPLWFYILGGLYKIALIFPDPVVVFRYLVVTVLSAVDVGIFFIVAKRYGLLAGAIFFLNPIVVIITGFHNQFDNLALLLMMGAILLFQDRFEDRLSKRKIGGLLLMGFSLITKHIFFAFPLWLAIKQRGWWQKLVVLTIPVGMFLMSFLPFWASGKAGIIHNVFRYKSFDNAPLMTTLLPGFHSYPLNFVIFLAALVGGAYLFRKQKTFEALLTYSVVLVIFSPSVVNQYLAIPISFIAVNLNPFLLIFNLVAFLHLMKDGVGLNIESVQRIIDPKWTNYNVQVSLLFIGFLWYLKGVFKPRNKT